MSGESVIYARAGEDIVCEAGHLVTRPMRDVHLGEVVSGDLLEGMGHLRSSDPAKGILGDPVPDCSCGQRWYWNGLLRFRAGYRVCEGGNVAHLSLAEVQDARPYRVVSVGERGAS